MADKKPMLDKDDKPVTFLGMPVYESDVPSPLAGNITFGDWTEYVTPLRLRPLTPEEQEAADVQARGPA